MGHYDDGWDFERKKNEERIKKDYTGWIKEQLESKTSEELRDIHTIIDHIEDVRGVMDLLNELSSK